MITPNLKDVGDFITVVEAGGFRGAAKLRGSSASSLSDAVRRLEAELGIRLLNRTTRSVTPTKAGAGLIERLKPIFSEIEATFNDLRDEASLPLGTLKLNVPVPVARDILPPITTGFLERYPGIHLDVVMENDFSDVFGRGFDAGVRYMERIDKDMIAIPIGPRRQFFAAAASHSYIEKYGAPDRPQDLLIQHRLIGNRFPNGSIWAWEFERDGELKRIVPDGPLTSSSIDLQLAGAVAGAGIIYTFEDFLRPHFESGEIVPILEPWWQEFEGPYLYYSSRRHMPSPLRAFVDYVKEWDTGQ